MAAGRTPTEELWEREYTELKVLPTSNRTSPSKAVVLLSQALDLPPPLIVLDAGCGLGRNAVYFAQRGDTVYAVDLSSTAVESTGRLAAAADVADRVHASRGQLDRGFPFQDESFDLVLDSYVFCHLSEISVREAYRHEMYRVAKSNGYVLSTVFSLDDSYYGPLLHGEDRTVVDPRNGIAKRLYAEQEIRTFYETEFRVAFFARLEFPDVVLGRTYWRSILAYLLRKP
jgi:SAM-dependent methyltransferase